MIQPADFMALSGLLYFTASAFLRIRIFISKRGAGYSFTFISCGSELQNTFERTENNDKKTKKTFEHHTVNYDDTQRTYHCSDDGERGGYHRHMDFKQDG